MTSVGSRHESKFQGKYSSRAHHFMGLLLVVVLAFAGVIFTEEKAESSASLLTPQGNILSIVSGSDDSSQVFSLTDVFEHGVTFGSNTHTSIYVGSNGYITFTTGWNRYSPLGIEAWEEPFPIIAGQYDDLKPANGGSIYAIADVDNDRVVITFDTIRAYRTPVFGTDSAGVTFQIVLKKPGTYSATNRDFDIEIRYGNIGWWQSGNNSAPPSAGWSTGTDSPVYQELPRSGSPSFNLTANESNVEEPGVYRWSVSGGEVAAPPTVSTTASAGSIGPTGATLSGDVVADGGDTVTARGVVVSTADDPQVGAAGVTSFSSEDGGTGSFAVDVSDLNHSTKYYFRAWAQNEEGYGYGRTSTFRTTTLTVPGSPTSVSVVGENESASLTFAAPVSNGGAEIEDYEYSLDSTSSFTPLGSAPGTFTIPDLTNNQTYAVRVRAVNGQGRGNASTPVNVTPGVATAPTITSLTPGNGVLAVGFSGPSSTGGIAITDYEYSTDDGDTWSSAGTATSPFTISGLTNGDSYQVKIRAVGSFPGEPSSRSTASPASTVPGVPTITSLSRDSASVTVSFTAPSDDGGESIVNYEYSTNGTDYVPFSPRVTVGPVVIERQSTTGAPALVNGVSYSISLKAKNSNGLSGASATVRASPAAPPPSADTGGGSASVIPEPAVTPPTVTPRVIPRLPATPATPPTQQGPVLRGNVPPAPPSVPTATIGGRSTPIQTQVTSPTGFSLTAGVLNLGLQVEGDQGVVRQNGTGGTEVEVKKGSTTALTGSGLLPRSTVQVFLPLQGTNAKEVARIPVDETGAFSGDAVFATRANERPMPIGRQVMQIVSLDEDGQQSVVEMTINIAQGAPAPEPDRIAGEVPALTPGQSVATNAGEPEVVRVTADSAVKSATVDGDGWTMSVNIEGARGEVSESGEGGALLEFVRDEGIIVAGGGFMPGTRADVWLFSEPTLLGTVDIDENGEFSGTVMVDGNAVPVGDHTLQLQGVGEDGYVRAANLGVVVNDAAPEVLTEDAAGGFLWWLVALVAVIGLAAALTIWQIRSRRA